MNNSCTLVSTPPAGPFRRTRRRTTHIALSILFALALASVSAPAQAYRVRPFGRPTPRYVGSGGTLTVSATPNLVNFNLVSGGTAQGSTGVTITTAWDIVGIFPTLDLYGYFTSSTAALTDGRSPAHLIPSSAVLGQVTTGAPTSYTPFTQTAPFGGAGASLDLVSTTLGLFVTTGNRTDVLNLRINLSGLSSLPAGTYTGTLTLQASMN